MTHDEMRIARINNGDSIRGLARELQVPEQSIRRIERGEGISLPYAKRLADYHGVQVIDILPMPPYTIVDELHRHEKTAA